MSRSEARRLFRRCLRGNVSGSPANGFVIPVHTAARVVGCPGGLFLEEADGPNAAVAAEIEPVQRPARNANQVSGFNFDRYNRALRRMNVEQPTPSDNVTNLVFIVRMFDVEFCQHLVQPRSICVHVDPVRRDVAALTLELFYLLAVSAQHLVCRSIRRQFGRRLPAFVVDANPCEVVAHLAVFAERTVLIGDSKDSHGVKLPSSASAGITHFVQRRSEPALPSGTPEFQHGAWLPASPHPKYKAHAPSKEIRGCRGLPAGFLKHERSARPCPANFRESAATRGACGYERLPVL